MKVIHNIAIEIVGVYKYVFVQVKRYKFEDSSSEQNINNSSIHITENFATSSHIHAKLVFNKYWCQLKVVGFRTERE